MGKKILIVGETWVTTATHTKGFDSFITTTFHEGYSFLKSALEQSGYAVDVIENHVAPTHFPETVEALQQYSTVILSDIGANTLLLHPKTWLQAQSSVNKLTVIADYAKSGGGLIMVGGYLTFTGIEAKGCWKDTVVEDCLPVRLMATDDRREHPEGIVGTVVKAEHPVMKGVEGPLPAVLGYNRVTLAEGAELIATVGNDPLLALTESGAGRTAAFMTDCSPHWCPIDFIDWPGYRTLWSNLCAWTGKKLMDGATIDLLHDCDPGNDDAVAILAALGHPAVTLHAVTTGAGHLSGDRTAINGAITVAAAHPKTVPVSAGAMGPLLRDRLIARILDMENGLDPVRADLDQGTLDTLHSVDRIAAEVKAHPGITIVTTGPLTNLALALRRYPDIHGGIGRIVTLSGAWGLGTKSAAAEWNILCDPEAAAIVYGSSIPITMVPVDASGTVPITQDLIGRIAALPGRAAALAAELLASLITTYRPGIFVPPEMPLHDPCAVLVAAAPGIVTTVPARVDVDTAQGLNYGRTVVDFAGRTDRPNNCDVVIAFDVAATHDALVTALAALSKRQTEA